MFDIDKNLYQNIPHLGSANHYLDEISDNIDQFGLLRHFNTGELTVLSRYLQCYAAPRGYYLFEKGQTTSHLVIILSGEVNIETDNDALSVDNGDLGVGTTIGGEAFTEHHQWGVSFITTKPTDFAVLTRENLNEILMHSPRLGNQFLLAMVQSMVVRIKSMQQQTGVDSELILS